jgi:prepilin signal peptidase PulO-like enzyme (type II secretory pathway)
MTAALSALLLAALAIADLRTRLLPDALLLAAASIGIALQPEPSRFVEHALAGAALYGFGLAARWIGERRFGPGALGEGDARLLGAIGASCGAVGGGLALLLGALALGPMGLWHRQRGARTLPLGAPFALAAAVVVVARGIG